MSSSSINGRAEVQVSSKSSSGFRLCCCIDDTGPDQDDTNIPKPRGCTDIIYLIVYVIFCCVMILIAAFAFVYGNPLRLINGMDSFGNVCGTTNENFGNLSFSGLDMSDKPYVFFFNVKDMDRSTKICVSQCPDKDFKNMDDLADFFEQTSINLCRYDFNLTEWRDESVSAKTGEAKMEFLHVTCPRTPYYSSHAILKRCIPQKTANIDKDLFFNIYAYLNSLNIFKQILGDLAITWLTVLGLTGVAFVLSFSMIILLHWMTTCLSYLILIAVSLLSVGLTGFLWWTFIDIKSVLDSKEEEMILEEMVKNERAFLAYSIISTIFTVFLLLVVFVLRKRVAIVVQLFRESGSVLCAMPCLIVQPFLTYFALSAFLCCWLYIVLCLATADYPTTRQVSVIPVENSSLYVPPGFDVDDGSIQDGTSQPEAQTANVQRNLEDIGTLTLIEYSEGSWVKYMWWIYIIGLIWVSEFILGCQQMVIASSVAFWYFSRDRPTLKCVIMKSIWRLVKYHVGSVALGSLIITFAKLPRLLISLVQRTLRKLNQWKFVKVLTMGCNCCICLFENGLKYVHHNAYPVIAIQGVDFCPASRLAFAALVQNVLQVSAVNSTGDFVLFLAKCIIAAVTGLVATLVFRNDDSLYFYAMPVLLTVVFSYFVAHCVISMFEIAVDTLFLCFCEDHNMNDGSPGKEYYSPPSLFKYMTVDAVNAVAARRTNYNSTISSKKPPTDFRENADETIPMNPTHA